MMLSSIKNDRNKALKKDGHRIVKLMGYDENDYDRIISLINSNYKNAASFVGSSPATHLPYSKGGQLKFTLLGFKTTEGISEESNSDDGITHRCTSL